MEITIKINGRMTVVEVSAEVAEVMDAGRRKAENLSHEQRRHWDGREFDEYIAATEGLLPYQPTPEDIVCQRETLALLLSILDTCTAIQRERFLLYALYDYSYAEIGMVCGCSKVSAFESIEAVRKKFLKFFENHPNAQPDYRCVFALRESIMKVKISEIKINPGRRETEPKAIEELVRSIAAVGLMNPVTLDQNNTLIAGLHRLEAAKLMGWTEIECNIIGMSGLQAELAEIDENIVRTKLTKQELGDQLLRRKDLYEMLHPETKAGAAQAVGMNRAIGNNVAARLAPTTKSFVEDTSEKTGMSKRTISRLLQIANNMTQDAKRIVQASDLSQDTALKISRLPDDQQAEAASLLAAGTVQSVEQYRQERRERIMVARPPLPDEPSEDTRTEAEKNREKVESLNGLVREFSQFVEQFLDRMKMYQGFADAFAEMSQTQISQVWDSAAAVDMAIIDFSKEVKAIQAENENGGNEHEN